MDRAACRLLRRQHLRRVELDDLVLGLIGSNILANHAAAVVIRPDHVLDALDAGRWHQRRHRHRSRLDLARSCCRACPWSRSCCRQPRAARRRRCRRRPGRSGPPAVHGSDLLASVECDVHPEDVEMVDGLLDRHLRLEDLLVAPGNLQIAVPVVGVKQVEVPRILRGLGSVRSTAALTFVTSNRPIACFLQFGDCLWPITGAGGRQAWCDPVARAGYRSTGAAPYRWRRLGLTESRDWRIDWRTASRPDGRFGFPAPFRARREPGRGSVVARGA